MSARRAVVVKKPQALAFNITSERLSSVWLAPGFNLWVLGEALHDIAYIRNVEHKTNLLAN